MLREFDPRSREAGDLDVPDPYYGGDEGFDEVLDLVDAGTRGLLEALRARGPRLTSRTRWAPPRGAPVTEQPARGRRLHQRGLVRRARGRAAGCS